MEYHIILDGRKPVLLAYNRVTMETLRKTFPTWDALCDYAEANGIVNKLIIKNRHL